MADDDRVNGEFYLDSLVGRRGQITTGRATKGSAARTKVYDRHGQAHRGAEPVAPVAR